VTVYQYSQHPVSEMQRGRQCSLWRTRSTNSIISNHNTRLYMTQTKETTMSLCVLQRQSRGVHAKLYAFWRVALDGGDREPNE